MVVIPAKAQGCPGNGAGGKATILRNLLVDAPRQAIPAMAQTLNACSERGAMVCLTSIGSAVQQLWGTAIGQPVRAFEVPPGIESTAVVFAVGATIASLVAQFPWAGVGHNVRTIAALATSFLLPFISQSYRSSQFQYL
jgi:hypothetical protein